MALIPPHYLDSVFAIGQTSSDGKTTNWVATGFFYGLARGKSEDGKPGFDVFAVTNRHVIEGLKEGTARARLNPTAEGGKAVEMNLRVTEADGSSSWVFHPNPSVDVAVSSVDISRLQQRLRMYFFESTNDVAFAAKMADLGTSEGDFAFVLGFPMGLVGGDQNAVIVRSGSIARIRESIVRPQEPFTVDSFVFPGNSGGPVILKPETLAIRGTKALDRALVVGIVCGYVSYQDVAISQQTKRQRVVFEENSGLAAVHTMDTVEEAIRAGLPDIGKLPEPVAAPA